MNMMISIPEASTAAAVYNLQSCICGWAKVTSITSLKLHQGRKRCLKKVRQATRIYSYFLRGKLSPLTEVQQQNKNHSLQNDKNPVPVEEELDKGEQPEPSTLRPTAKKKIQGWRQLIKWPRSCKKTMWREVNDDLWNILQTLRGTTMKKLERMGDLIYNYGVELLGVVEKKGTTPVVPSKSGRQKEIDRLIRDRRQLKKQWRKITEEEREGINVLQTEIRGRLATMRRAENLVKKRRKKEWTSLLNVVGKIFFSVVAHRLAGYLQRNELIDTSIQKADISGYSSCLEHASIIWHQIQHLEVGIMAGCTISPLAFTMAIIRASRWVVRGQRIRPGLRMLPVRAYMNDLTTLSTTKACTLQLLRKLQENIELAQMKNCISWQVEALVHAVWTTPMPHVVTNLS